ncbi:GNAT family N-acetyltransferase [Puteibacter caeruleilacunae]|nr:GNAT family N-acetyltransferase [Puteibacter caeruleilacunae]
MQVIEVTNQQTEQQFCDVARILYKGEPNWICQLDGSVKEVFDPEKNNCFKNGKAIRWILKDDNNQLIGRIAAFVNGESAYQTDIPTGGCGYFECINNQEAANTLFNLAKNWLGEQGMKAMEGPVNFGENMENWGLLVDGFIKQGYGMPYHHEYYRDLFETYGFKTNYEQYSYHLDIKKAPDLPSRFWKIAAWVANKPDFKFECFDYKNKKKFIRDFIEIHKEAWSSHGNYKPVIYEEIEEMIDKAKFIVEEEFIWFAYHKDKPVAFFFMMPDFNQILQYFNGRLHWYSILKLLYLKMRKKITRARVMAMGVVPQFQKSGLESALFWHTRQVLLKKNWFDELELSWVGDFNPKMISIFEAVGGKKAKTHITMKYMIDPTIAFERAPIIND